MNDTTFVEFAITVRPDAVDAVADFLGGFSGGVVLEEAPGAVRILAYVPEARSGQAAFEVERYMSDLAEMGIVDPGSALQMRETPAGGWMSVFRSHHNPVEVSDRLTVRPSWCPPGTGREIIIDPGLAFGTGSHATTLLSLVLLDRELARRMSENMLDLGTGTGILAIAAASLDAKNVLAVDISPTAVAVALKNIAVNAVEDRVRAVEGTINSVQGPFDLITANLTGGLLLYIYRELSACLAEGGTLIMSGIMEDDRDGIVAAFTGVGLRAGDQLQEKEWVALMLRK